MSNNWNDPNAPQGGQQPGGWDQNQQGQPTDPNAAQANQNWNQSTDPAAGAQGQWDQSQQSAGGWDQDQQAGGWDQNQHAGYGAPGAGYGAPTIPPGAEVGPGGLPLATWPKRALGALIDIVLPSIVIGIIWGLLFNRDQFGTSATANSVQMNYTGNLLQSPVTWLIIGLIAGALASKTGQTPGRKIAKTQLLTQDGQVPSFGIIVGRSVLHILDSLLCCVGFLFPLWDKQRQTFADKILKTYVVDVEQTGPINTKP